MDSVKDLPCTSVEQVHNLRKAAIKLESVNLDLIREIEDLKKRLVSALRGEASKDEIHGAYKRLLTRAIGGYGNMGSLGIGKWITIGARLYQR